MNKHIEQQVEKTFNSLDGMDRAKANPFLAAKVLNRMQQRLEPVYNGKLVLRYVMLILVLAGLNIVTLYVFRQPGNQHTGIESATYEYTATTVFEYE